jgi:serine phosphatase RsbU (regulator of sigma subunit)
MLYRSRDCCPVRISRLASRRELPVANLAPIRTMTTLPTEPIPARRKRSSITLVVWAVSVAIIIAYKQIEPAMSRAGVATGFFTFVTFLAALSCIAITLYWIATAIRFLMRRLFFRVGRRLFLSYILIGLLPFFLMTILLLACGYMVAGVMSHAALRGERQATLGQMESSALEYALTAKKPTDALPTLELYDSANGTADKLPEWLRKTSFSGMVWRAGAPLLVASRQFSVAAGEAPRAVVLVQPLDENWARQLEDKGGMIISYDRGRHAKLRRAHVVVNGKAQDVEVASDDAINDVFTRGVAYNRVIWGDPSVMSDWATGRNGAKHQLFTLISNPISNLFQFYFGTSSGRYVNMLERIILSITVMLFIMYLMAAMFAAVLIFSISRAVNRIEKGTKAVERGDFTYRIRMKPHNQLGEMAQSFDRMTESISSLLTTVAEKERLQSEIAIAATIQRNLLPKEGPRFRGVSFSAHFEPTASIGGDYYDVFNLDKSRLAVAIGDVSGHGLSTGLVMAMVKAAITTLVEEGADESSLFRRLNDLVFRSTERRAFMTLGFTIFDLEHGHIRHTNAGHLYPYLIRRGQSPLAIESPSLPLGVRSEITTHTVDLDLLEGDAIVYLSDGIVEAQNDDGDPFGFEQLEALLAQSSDRSPDAVRDAILDAVAHHAGGRPADDDRTVMILRFDQFRTLRAPQAVPAEVAVV